MHDANPLLDQSDLPRFRDIAPEHVEPAVDALLARNRALVEQLAPGAAAATWESFVRPLSEAGDALERAWAPIAHLHAVADSEALRAAHEVCLAKLTDHRTELAQDERLARGFRAVAARDDFDSLDEAQRKIVGDALRDFRLGGVELPPADKARFKAISQRLSELSNRFAQNLLDATNAWSLPVSDADRLAGLPPSALDLARQTAERNGRKGYEITLHAPSYVAVMTYADDRALRERLYRAYVTRASAAGEGGAELDNGDIIDEILALRHELAGLVGFPCYAEYSLATKMAPDPERVNVFLDDLARRARPFAEQELAALAAFARERHAVDKLEAWDIAYISEKLRVERYDFSQEDVRPYFPVDRVLEGMFEIVRRLFGVRVEARDGVDTWHDDVRLFEILDDTGARRGRFYVDLYARPHKQGGAWMADCVGRKRDTAGTRTPVAFLTCNFSPPVDGKPALLSHDEVITLFHEFGHGLHHMLTLVDHLGAAGIDGVAWDAVELPSQFLENWCWEREALDLVGGHHVTGEKLPEPLLEKMRAARHFQSGMRMVRQLEFSLFDLRLHAGAADGPGFVQRVLDAVRDEVAVVIPPDFNRFQNGFSHIFAGGYAAGYYSYKWAEVLSADAFSLFEDRGVFDADTGRSFLHNILERGGSREAMDLFVAFRGREPRIDALLRLSGLVAA